MPSSRPHAGVCRRVVAGTMSYLDIEGVVGVVEAQREVVLVGMLAPNVALCKLQRCEGRFQAAVDELLGVGPQVGRCGRECTMQGRRPEIR